MLAACLRLSTGATVATEPERDDTGHFAKTAVQKSCLKAVEPEESSEEEAEEEQKSSSKKFHKSFQKQKQNGDPLDEHGYVTESNPEMSEIARRSLARSPLEFSSSASCSNLFQLLFPSRHLSARSSPGVPTCLAILSL